MPHSTGLRAMAKDGIYVEDGKNVLPLDFLKLLPSGWTRYWCELCVLTGIPSLF